jgi:hypothetical protein
VLGQEGGDRASDAGELLDRPELVDERGQHGATVEQLRLAALDLAALRGELLALLLELPLLGLARGALRAQPRILFVALRLRLGFLLRDALARARSSASRFSRAARSSAARRSR